MGTSNESRNSVVKFSLRKRFMKPSHYFALCALLLMAYIASCMAVDAGGPISSDFIFRLSLSPYRVHEDIIIAKGAKVTIEPGVEVQFAPAVGFKVKGTLIARGTPDKRIVFTKLEPSGNTPEWPSDIRLVEGFDVMQGRLQLFYQNRWRGICTNFRNASASISGGDASWTLESSTVACRQLGYKTGNFTFKPVADNETYYMLLDRPQCNGVENHILSCPGSKTVKLGKHVCDNQITGGLICFGVNQQISNTHWKGITFFNSTFKMKATGRNRSWNESTSVLEYVDIMYAGVNETGNLTAALSASPHPPPLNYVRVLHNAYDGVNFTEISGSVNIQNSEFINNRGNGLNISSYYGLIDVRDSKFEGNKGDGLRARLLDGVFHRLLPLDLFCQRSVLEIENFPLVLPGFPYLSSPCYKTLRTLEDEIITASLMEVQVDPSAEGQLDFYDGTTDSFKLLASIPLKNYTFHQAITSTGRAMYISFSWKGVMQMGCQYFRKCVKFTLLLTSGKKMTNDVFMKNVIFHNNLQNGAHLINMRSRVTADRLTLTNNSYGAGLKVYEGATDVHVSNSIAKYNERSGINITTTGGEIIVNEALFEDNKDHGLVTRYIHFNKTRIEEYHSVSVIKTIFRVNNGIGVFFGNYCGNGHISLNESRFEKNGVSIRYESCEYETGNMTNLTIAFNTFERNNGVTIDVSPALRIYGQISNNTFSMNKQGAIQMDNTDDYLKTREYRKGPVDYGIYGNTFLWNRGWFVANLRLTHKSVLQQLTFKENVLSNNIIVDPFPGLNPRTRAASVLIVSSSSISVHQNSFSNQVAVYEIATHLKDPSHTINVEANFFNYMITTTKPDIAKIDSKIFDRYKRYDLGTIRYFPVLEVDRLFEKNLVKGPSFEQQFHRNNVIGGNLIKTYTLPKGDYTVDIDINILPGNTLVIQPGTTIQFANSIGMLVQGQLESTGTLQENIIFSLVPSDAQKINHTSLRLVGGVDEFEGRVEVKIDGRWGTICNEGWSLHDAAVVCQELGMTLHPHHWVPKLKTVAPDGVTIWLSNVDCDDYSTNILNCKYDRPNDHSCDHSMDVNVRCQPKTWSGIHFTMNARASKIQYAQLDSAGLFDYFTLSYTPAIQIDYNEHHLSNLKIKDCVSSGIMIIHNNPFSKPRNEINTFDIRNNLENGIMIKSPYIDIKNGVLEGNQDSGLKYDPSMSTEEGAGIRNLISNPKNLLDYTNTPLDIPPNDLQYAVAPVNGNIGVNEYVVEIQTQEGSWVHIEILDYNPDIEEEHVIFFSGLKTDISSGLKKNWTIDKDLVDFPIASEGRYLTMKLSVNGALSGRLTMVIRSMGQLFKISDASVILSDMKLINNRIGVQTIYYNDHSNEHFDIFFRRKDESFSLMRTVFQYNKEEALYIPSRTKYHEHYMPTYKEMEGSARISEIVYSVEDSEFTGNGIGVVGDHNHVEFANNVWKWKLSGCKFRNNKARGFSIDLPLIGRNFRERDLLYDYQDFIAKNPDAVPTVKWWNDQNNNWDPNDPNTWNNNDAIKWMQEQVWMNWDWKNLKPEEQRRVLINLHKELWFLWHKVVNHTVAIDNNVFENNADFEFRLSGYYAKTVISNNTFLNNVAKIGIATISGMEKLIEMSGNVFSENVGRYVIDFALSNHYEFEVTVPGLFHSNKIKNNRPPPGHVLSAFSSNPSTYALGINGVQNITVKRNLFDNAMQYEFVAGVQSSWIENAMDVSENWWGTTDQDKIHGSIFDFDNWNNFAIATYYPFLIEDRFDSPLSSEPFKDIVLDINKPLGGRIVKNIELTFRSEPYIVQRDITVMPGANLIIKPGVKLHFWPNVGILVLGRMVAMGEWYKPIVFKPYPLPSGSGYQDIYHNLGKRSIKAPKNVQVRLVGGILGNEGFLEMFNETVHRWELVCDPLFNERTGRVICRTMNLESSNVIVKRSYLYDSQIYGYNRRSVKYFWDISYQCNGDEARLDQCLWQPNYKKTLCSVKENYVFVRCGARNIQANEQYWGNLRFASVDIENVRPDSAYSYLQHVDIYGAGILHGHRVAAIQSTYQPPVVDRISIKNCAYSACDYVAPRFSMTFGNSTVQSNLGHGLGYLNLNGESRDVATSSFRPLVESTIPYHAFGIVRMCDSAKEITLKNRLLLYFKYDYQSASCSKIIRSKVTGKRVAFRFLQFNLFYDNFSKNAIELFNGDYFSNTSAKITEILPDAPENIRNKKFETSGRYDVLGIHLHASAAPGSYGFIAEVVTLPLSPLSYPLAGREMDHVIASNRIEQNQGGAIAYMNVGEVNPNIHIVSNHISSNGLQILNLTAAPMVNLLIQNSWRLQVANNFIFNNRGGGIHIATYSVASSTAVNANVTNNFMDSNTHGEILNTRGSHYQKVRIASNYIAHNSVENRNVIFVAGVAVNFTRNVVFENVGSYIMNISSIQKVGTYQHYFRNYFYRNQATGPHHSTMFVTNSRMRIQDNFFYNRKNDFELTANNRTIPIIGSLDPIDTAPIDARYNWWGSELEFYIRGRMWEFSDDWWLIKVDYSQYHRSNQSVLEGRCPPGWLLNNERCFIYMGGAMPFNQAKDQCRHESALLADAKDRVPYFVGQLSYLQSNYDRYISRAWVLYSGPTSPGKCTVVRDVYLEAYDCNALLPFFCEKDPYPNKPFKWLVIIIVASVLAGVLIIILIVVCCWYVKSKRRTKERFDRRNSLRASMKSSRSVVTSGGFNTYNRSSRRKGTPSMKSGITAISGATLDFSSTDTLEKKLDGFTTPSSTLEHPRRGNYYDTNDNPYSARLENEIANVISRPTMYDAVYENQMYDDSSFDKRRRRRSFEMEDIDLYDDADIKPPVTPETPKSPSYASIRPRFLPQKPPSVSSKTQSASLDEYEYEPFKKRGYTNTSFDSEEKNLSDFELSPDDVKVELYSSPRRRPKETDM